MFRFDGHLAMPFSPKVNLKLGRYEGAAARHHRPRRQALMFDYGLRYYTLSDAGWQQYHIPEELSERPFRGGGRKEHTAGTIDQQPSGSHDIKIQTADERIAPGR